MTLLAAAPLNHQEHRYQRQLTSWLSAHAVSNFRSPKGRNQVSQLPYSREVTETHSFYHLARARCPQSQERGGSRPPSWAPSPGSCPPLSCQALTPDRCVFVCSAKTAGFKIAPVPTSVCVPQGRCSEPEELPAKAEPPTPLLPGLQELGQVSQTTVS